MTTTLERAARAIHDVDQRRDPIVPDWEWVSQDAYMSMARAVLMALRDEAPTKAMAESQATDDEGEFAPMLDLIDFSGENKTSTVLRQAWIDGIDAILEDTGSPAHMRVAKELRGE